MIVQIYEITSPEEGKKVAELGIDFIGVVAGEGKYYAGEMSFNKTREIFSVLPKTSKRVVLSLSNDLKELSEVITNTNPDILHMAAMPNSLSLTNAINLKKHFPKIEIMRSIPVIDKSSIELAKQYEGVADYLLLDSYKKEASQFGITGEIHDWNISREIVASVNIPVILAGGLGPNNVAEAIKAVNPAGVDSKTKTDQDNGKGKDLTKVSEFVKIAKSFN
jgi:phosphoribosylanthranilate isomerase